MTRSALKRLVARLDEYPAGYEPSSQVFLPLDPGKLKRELDLERRGEQNGEADEPPTDSAHPDAVEQEILARITTEVKQALDVHADRQRDQNERIARLDITGRAFELEAAARDAIADFRSEVSQGQDDLLGAGKDLDDHAQELAAFKREHGLRRTADYPRARYWCVAVALLFGFVEFLGNCYFFSAGSDFGFLGASIEAVVAALLNVGVSFLAGNYPARWLAARRLGWRISGVLLLLAWLLVITVINLATAHYRDLLEAGFDDAVQLTVPRLLASPFAITSLFSWMLLGLGYLMALLSLIEGHAFDDRYPGYGNVARRYEAARRSFTHLREEIIGRLSAKKADTIEDLRRVNDDIGHRRAEFHQTRAARRRLEAQLAGHLDYLEQTQNELLASYQAANRRTRSTPAPARFALPVPIRRPVLMAPIDPYDEATVDGESRKAGAAALGAVREVTDEFELAFRQLEQLKDVLIQKAGHDGNHRQRRLPRPRGSPRHSTHGRRDLMGKIVICVVAVLILAGVIGAMTLRSGRAAVDPETFCPVDGPTEIVTVLIDTTDPMTPVQAEAVARRLAEVKSDVPTGAVFELYRVEPVDQAPLAPSVRLCNPGRPEEVSQWNGNPRKAARKFAEHFDLPIQNAIAQANAAPAGNSSPILEALQSVAVTAFSGPGRSDRPHRLLIVSDMLQHSQVFSLYRGDDLGALRDQDRFLRLRPALAGAEVSILLLSRADGRVKQGREFILHWSELLAASGGELVAVDRI